MKKILTLIVLLVLVGICIYLSKNKAIDNNDKLDDKDITWKEITVNGVNEKLLIKNVDNDILAEVSTELQALVDEAYEEERENPEILITEGWARVFNYDRFKKVIDIGKPAMKPLYLIIYKSPNRGEYEYLCAYALYKISGYDFEWATTDEFMMKFNEYVVNMEVGNKW